MPSGASKNRILTAVDLFAGAGGFTIAAQQSGIRVLAAVEIDKHACATYKANLIVGKENPPVLIEQDINSIQPAYLMKQANLRVQQCDILMGGPPCQGYSTHRINSTGVGDPRNELLIRYFDFVKALKPKAFVVENVSGLLWPRHADYLKRFFRLAREAGYDVRDPTLLNARDYGVPQNRRRVFIIGFRNDLKVELAWPPERTHFAPASEEVRNGSRPAWITAGEVFKTDLREDDPNAIHMNHSPELVRVFESTPKDGGSRAQSNRTLRCHKDHDGHKDVYGRIDPSKPGPTMTTACVNPSKGRFLHPTENHGICVRHAARFQTFPENFEFEGGLMASAVQIGNAVPIELGKAVLAAIAAGVTTAKRRCVGRNRVSGEERI